MLSHRCITMCKELQTDLVLLSFRGPSCSLSLFPHFHISSTYSYTITIHDAEHAIQYFFAPCYSNWHFFLSRQNFKSNFPLGQATGLKI